MGAIEPWHLILLLAVVLLVVGPGKLPQVGKGVGEAIREFRQATSNTQPAPQPQPAPAQPAPAQPAPAQPAPAPNTLSGSVAPNTIAEPGTEGTPRA